MDYTITRGSVSQHAAELLRTHLRLRDFSRACTVRVVLSVLPVSTVLLSGPKATRTTLPRCSNVTPTALPVADSHSRAVVSWLPVITVLPSGLNATAWTTP